MTISIEQKRQSFIVDDRIRKMIAGAVAEVDPAQIAMLRKMTPADRFAQMISMMRFTETAAVDRLCLSDPYLGEDLAYKIVRGGQMMAWLVERRKRGQCDE